MTKHTEAYAEACRFLEQIQANGIRMFGYPLPEILFDDDWLRQFYDRQGGFSPDQSFEEFSAQTKKLEAESRRSCPSRFEDAHWYSVVTRMAADLERSAAELELGTKHNYLFGTLNTQRVNGLILPVPNNPYYLILIETGLFGFANLIGKVVSLCFEWKQEENGMLLFSTDWEACRRRIDNDPEPAMRLFDLLIAYVVDGSPHGAAPYVVSRAVQTLATTFREGMEYFVLAHEIGHQVCGHMERPAKSLVVIADRQYDEAVTSWQQEFEADITGLSLTLHVMQRAGYDITLSTCGIELFFSSLELVGKSLGMLRYGKITDDTGSATHPPLRFRKDALHRILAEADAESQASGKFSHLIEQILDALWQRIEPDFLLLHNKGVKPSPIWG